MGHGAHAPSTLYNIMYNYYARYTTPLNSCPWRCPPQLKSWCCQCISGLVLVTQFSGVIITVIIRAEHPYIAFMGALGKSFRGARFFSFYPSLFFSLSSHHSLHFIPPIQPLLHCPLPHILLSLSPSLPSLQGPTPIPPALHLASSEQ